MMRGEIESTARISTPDRRIAVRLIATDEEAMIARHTQTTIHHAAA
jgi:acetate kinase